ncbi:4-hydroxy-3-methylbut-2-enyl diphosphate reductase [Desulfonema magnum]|uniref:4-hydroxy-3-methylbut-2-enyl diphosphate reductase n=1 Tax=Desulfonema magnum TaxID=45655 RepID=A0A975BS62_9BACT|nr:4-hydroxy-3-methylbut-2-enyl diphosphate reductase [Desulfonema magnum]QTA90666.1 4-hydroxy-3-methylbut-2-enyl diphosphate reductase [Desulfonema magnum]
MKILIAKTAGFCMGVRRAVEMVLDAPRKHETPIFTYGPLIHNPQVLGLLKEKGITVINDIPDQGNGTVLIRAHGVPPQAKDKLGKAGFTVVDATCPRVIRVQTIIKKHANQGYETIIIGDRDHPEVIGLLGYAEEKGHVAGTLKDLEALPAFDKAIIVAQTTQNTVFFESVKKWGLQKFPHYKIFNTICDSTEKRQNEVKELTASVDSMIVVGGHSSGNTQRLAEIAQLSGKPAYHIETEAELDMKAIASVRTIGITAGASTPNWIIKRIYRALETLPLNKGQHWHRFFFALRRTLLLTNIYVSLGAGCLCYACSKLLGIPNYYSYVFIAMLYVQAMHIFNNLTGREADHYNDPERAFFYSKYKWPLAILAFLAGAAGLIKACFMGVFPFLILLFMSVMGLSYNLTLIPEKISDGNYRRIRDIPGSKTVLIAVAWGIVTSVFPSLSVSGEIDLGTILVFTWATGMVFVRSAFFDILDMQGDRVVGKDTIPILLGEKRTLGLLKSVLMIITLILIFSSAFHIISRLGFTLAICPIFMYLIVSAHERGYMLPGIRLEFLVETHFVLAGIITFIQLSVIGYQ